MESRHADDVNSVSTFKYMCIYYGLPIKKWVIYPLVMTNIAMV